MPPLQTTNCLAGYVPLSCLIQLGSNFCSFMNFTHAPEKEKISNMDIPGLCVLHEKQWSPFVPPHLLKNHPHPHPPTPKTVRANIKYLTLQEISFFCEGNNGTREWGKKKKKTIKRGRPESFVWRDMTVRQEIASLCGLDRARSNTWVSLTSFCKTFSASKRNLHCTFFFFSCKFP